jgi:predicted lipid-binding transport protein (Tim44 family)
MKETDPMGSSVIQLIILAGIALFLILRLRSVLGTRTGFEKPAENKPPRLTDREDRGFAVIEGGIDHDIADFTDAKSDTGRALAAMKAVEPSFKVADFAHGAKKAYEMILMAFEAGDLATLAKFLAPEVYDSFAQVVEDRRDKGWTVEAAFGGIRELKVVKAEFDGKTREADITIRFAGDLTSTVRDASGKIVEGDPRSIRHQKDVWTFSRVMGGGDPNWTLVATGG